MAQNGRQPIASGSGRKADMPNQRSESDLARDGQQQAWLPLVRAVEISAAQHVN